ncbi:phage major capsid protein [Bacillus cereus group sp. BfR-BA-01310]|uniref:phage major capsid protein n=1 Tax=Bacillus cereus group sp. BfR-BA-01310 TaxID=2920287 RepID=UPI001F56AC6E|nr:phage major capsid protein [Bacillus cereus group sp. BfR-BA-01310]
MSFKINGLSPEEAKQLNTLQTKANRLPGATNEPQIGVGKKAISDFKELLKTKSFVAEDGKYIEHKAIGYNSGSATGGNAFAPEGLANEILQKQLANADVKGALGFVTTPSDPFSFPVDETNWNVQVMAPGEQGKWDTANDTVNTSHKLTIRHSKLMASTLISTEYEEDAIPIALQQIQAGAGKALALKEESGVLFNVTNGLKATAVVDAAPALALTSISTEDTAHFAEKAFLSIIDSFETGYSKSMQDLVYIISPKLSTTFMRLPNFVSRDKIANPTNATGRIGSFFGAAVCASDSVDVSNAAGEFSVLVVHKDSVEIGQRRGLTVRLFPVVGDQDRMEITMRTGIEYPILNTGKNPGARIKKFKLS